MDFLPDTGAQWVAAISTILVGAFAIYAAFDKLKKERRKEADTIDDRLITLLKSTVDALERRVKDLEESQRQATIEMAKLRTENEVMTKLLQGRDSATIDYQKKGVEAIEMIKGTLAISQTTAKHVEDLYKLLESHFKRIPT